MLTRLFNVVKGRIADCSSAGLLGYFSALHGWNSKMITFSRCSIVHLLLFILSMVICPLQSASFHIHAAVG
jgi:hypothetical protein